MTDLDVQELLKAMLEAAQGEFKEKWPTIKDFAKSELEKLANTLVQIGKLKATGQITEGEAKILLEMQKNTARTVMLTLEGMGLLLVEAAINSALAVVKDTVNGAVGFVLV
jgi:hypothetical protein